MSYSASIVGEPSLQLRPHCHYYIGIISAKWRTQIQGVRLVEFGLFSAPATSERRVVIPVDNKRWKQLRERRSFRRLIIRLLVIAVISVSASACVCGTDNAHPQSSTNGCPSRWSHVAIRLAEKTCALIKSLPLFVSDSLKIAGVIYGRCGAQHATRTRTTRHFKGRYIHLRRILFLANITY